MLSWRGAVGGSADIGGLLMIAIGRKAWLFAGSDRGGERAAAMFTLIERAKLQRHRSAGLAHRCPYPDQRTPGRQARRTPTLEMERPG
jgi:hypothetical protein